MDLPIWIFHRNRSARLSQSVEHATLNLRSWVQAPRWVAHVLCIPSSSVSIESACSAGDLGLIPGSGRSLEKEMAIHSNIVGKSHGGLQSIGSQRVGHDWAADTYLLTLMEWIGEKKD